VAEWRIEDHRGVVRDFVAELDSRDYQDSAALIHLLAARGDQVREPRSKALGGGLFELRGRQVRIYCTFGLGRRIVLLAGFIKKRGDIPSALMRRLRQLQSEVT
jgi:hypothetical protein